MTSTDLGQRVAQFLGEAERWIGRLEADAPRTGPVRRGWADFARLHLRVARRILGEHADELGAELLTRLEADVDAAEARLAQALRSRAAVPRREPARRACG